MKMESEKYLRLPYEGMQIYTENMDVHCRLPWVEIDAEMHPEEVMHISNGIEDIHRHNYLSEPAQNIFHQFRDYSVSYQVNRQCQSVRSLNGESTETDFFDTRRTPEWFRKELLLSPSCKHYYWSTQKVKKVASLAHMPHLFDAMTVVSYLVGQRLKFEYLGAGTRSTINENLDCLCELDESRMFYLVALIARQTYHITRSVVSSLEKHSASHPALRESLEGFIQEEVGHDRLFVKTITSLGFDKPESLPLLRPTQSMMQLFDYAAQRSPLALVSAIGMFEGAFYPESDPIADVLKKSSKPDSAMGYQRHFDINRQHNHKDEVYELASYMEPLDEVSLDTGMAIFELMLRYALMVDIEVSDRILRSIKSMLTH